MKKFLALIVALAVTSQAEWRRQVYSGKGAWSDTPQPHSLSYFTQDPLLRDDANDFCMSCTQAEKATLHLKFKARAELHRIGTLGGFPLFDVLYYFEQKDTPDWKFVLVRTGPDQYREIFHVQRTQTDQQVGFSSLIKAGNEIILSTRAFAGGNQGIQYGNYFWFDKNGPVMVDVDGPIRLAAEPLLPKGKELYGVWDIRLPALTASLPVRGENDMRCCTGGSVAIKFKLDQGLLVVTESHYVPPSQ
jgi:hypothetical protein